MPQNVPVLGSRVLLSAILSQAYQKSTALHPVRYGPAKTLPQQRRCFTIHSMKKRAALITALLLLAAGILLYCHDRNRQRTAPDTGGTALTARPISHVVVIVEENKPADSI